MLPERDRSRTLADDASSSGGFLGKGSRIAGKLAFEGPVRIEGHIEGEITAQDTLTIGESAVITARITGSSVIIHGRVTGDVTARKRVEIRAPGRLLGNIVTPSLVIHEGVVFEGQCSMGTTGAEPARSDPARAEPVRAEAPRAEKDRGGDKDRKVAHFPKEERPDSARAHAEGAAK